MSTNDERAELEIGGIGPFSFLKVKIPRWLPADLAKGVARTANAAKELFLETLGVLVEEIPEKDRVQPPLSVIRSANDRAVSESPDLVAMWAQLVALSMDRNSSARSVALASVLEKIDPFAAEVLSSVYREYLGKSEMGFIRESGIPIQLAPLTFDKIVGGFLNETTEPLSALEEQLFNEGELKHDDIEKRFLAWIDVNWRCLQACETLIRAGILDPSVEGLAVARKAMQDYIQFPLEDFDVELFEATKFVETDLRPARDHLKFETSAIGADLLSSVILPFLNRAQSN